MTSVDLVWYGGVTLGVSDGETVWDIIAILLVNVTEEDIIVIVFDFETICVGDMLVENEPSNVVEVCTI